MNNRVEPLSRIRDSSPKTLRVSGEPLNVTESVVQTNTPLKHYRASGEPLNVTESVVQTNTPLKHYRASGEPIGGSSNNQLKPIKYRVIFYGFVFLFDKLIYIFTNLVKLIIDLSVCEP